VLVRWRGATSIKGAYSSFVHQRRELELDLSVGGAQPDLTGEPLAGPGACKTQRVKLGYLRGRKQLCPMHDTHATAGAARTTAREWDPICGALAAFDCRDRVFIQAIQ
jgi:hypothetical protein